MSRDRRNRRGSSVPDDVSEGRGMCLFDLHPLDRPQIEYLGAMEGQLSKVLRANFDKYAHTFCDKCRADKVPCSLRISNQSPSADAASTGLPDALASAAPPLPGGRSPLASGSTAVQFSSVGAAGRSAAGGTVRSAEPDSLQERPRKRRRGAASSMKLEALGWRASRALPSLRRVSVTMRVALTDHASSSSFDLETALEAMLPPASSEYSISLPAHAPDGGAAAWEFAFDAGMYPRLDWSEMLTQLAAPSSSNQESHQDIYDFNALDAVDWTGLLNP
ncbi:hypothetical protein DFP72DRAFT_1174677 [Ephemerocybe angulata]|uniref:Uncharacterized protein n=1 Tax=Ephemerocybe angulata TaxID=980116 RepID=A0A8H6HK41_9AGAR|nr:hypothetical protein DFP72DRAFT_1174677 [Tulosesus angulatus]